MRPVPISGWTRKLDASGSESATVAMIAIEMGIVMGNGIHTWRIAGILPMALVGVLAMGVFPVKAPFNCGPAPPFREGGNTVFRPEAQFINSLLMIGVLYRF